MYRLSSPLFKKESSWCQHANLVACVYRRLCVAAGRCVKTVSSFGTFVRLLCP